eukprot:13797275-Ditylum_brightwellii.AAC.1
MTTNNKVVDDWKKQHRSDCEETTLPVPHFTVGTGSRKLGNTDNHVKTIVIHIDCAEADAMYLKILFLKAYKKMSRWNTYLNDIGVIAVESITKAALIQSITVEGRETTLMSYLMTSNLGLESIKQTNYTDERGN